MSRRWFVPLALVLLAPVPVASTHAQPLPTASGRVIEAADGDVVVVPSGARVAVVTRTQVQARLVYVAAQQTLLLLTDPALAFGAGMPEAKGFRSWRIENPWPLEPRWEGSATIDEYSPSGRGQPMAFAPLGLAIHTDRGTILVGPPMGREGESTPPPVAVVRTTAASSRVAQGSFDDIEQAWLAGGDNALQGPGGGMQMHASRSIWRRRQCIAQQRARGCRPCRRQHSPADENALRGTDLSAGGARRSCPGRRDPRARRRRGWRRVQRARPSVDPAARSGGARRGPAVALRTDAAERRAHARHHDGDGELLTPAIPAVMVACRGPLPDPRLRRHRATSIPGPTRARRSRSPWPALERPPRDIPSAAAPGPRAIRAAAPGPRWPPPAAVRSGPAAGCRTAATTLNATRGGGCGPVRRRGNGDP